MNNKLYLFPDTNVFLQCKPLSQVDFTLITQCDEIDIIISRPVQQEIDRQKGLGNTRLAKKAKHAASLFSQVLDANLRLCIREARPRVFLTMDLRLKPAESLADQLDYQEADDRFVGIAANFSESNTDSDVAIITNDSGPRFSAMNHNIVCHKVPDDWMLSPETDEKDKQIKLLETKLKQITDTMPEFTITAESEGLIKATYPRYVALDEGECSSLLEQLTSAFPLIQSFNGQKGELDLEEKMESIVRASWLEEFIPASEDDILQYTQTRYPEWRKGCEKVLRNCHESLNPRMIKHNLSFMLKNTGYAIADRAVVTFSAKGAFALAGSKWELRSEIHDTATLDFPSVPAAPKGKWRSRLPSLNTFDFERGRIMSNDRERFFSSSMASLIPPARDRNDFYYRESSELPLKTISLECEEWRHQVEELTFNLHAYLINKPGEINGAVEVRIDANNLVQPLIQTFKVELVIEERSAFALAQEKVHQFIREQSNKKLISL